jgi:hypothetical protein
MPPTPKVFHDHAAAGVLDVAQVNAIFLAVLATRDAPDVATIYLNDVGQLGAVMDDRAHRLAELVEQHEG